MFECNCGTHGNLVFSYGRLRKCHHYCLLERERENEKKGGGEGLTASVLQANDHCNDGTVVCFNLSVCGWSERCVHISVANLANFLPNVADRFFCFFLGGG